MMIDFNLMSSDGNIIKYSVNDGVKDFIVEVDSLTLAVKFSDDSTPNDVKYYVNKQMKSILNKVPHFYVAFG